MCHGAVLPAHACSSVAGAGGPIARACGRHCYRCAAEEKCDVQLMPLAWRREGQAYAYPGCCTASVRSTAIYTIIASSAA